MNVNLPEKVNIFENLIEGEGSNLEEEKLKENNQFNVSRGRNGKINQL
jgi:hypothetical protein